MLTAIRDRATGWLAWAVVIVISVPFALWGINQYFRGGAEVTVASVNGTDISQAEFQRALENERQALRRMLGSNIDPEYLSSDLFRRAVLDRMIDRRLMLQWAREQGYRVGDAQLGSLIREREAFQRGGEFSQELYRQALTASGYSVSDFEQQLRQQESVDQLRTGLTLSGFVPPGRVDRVLRLAAQRRVFDYVVLDPSRFEEGIDIEEEAIREQYDSNTDLYRVPESVRVNYVELSVGKLAEQVDVDEEEVRAAYEENRDRYGTEDTRRASHILIEVPADADAQTEQAALEQARQIAEQARGGADFAELAREYSDDSGSASQGGDLGVISRGAMPDAFEEALFGLAEGGVSDPVRTRFGFHVIKLTELEKGETVPFEDVRPELEAQIRRRRAEEQFLDMAETFRNLVFEHPDSLEVAAGELGLPVETSDWFDREGGQGIAANPNVVDVSFSPEVLEERLNSPVVEAGPDTLVAVHVIDHRPSSVRDLAEVRESIRAQLVRERAAVRAAEAGQEAVQRLRDGESWETVIGDLGVETTEASMMRASRQQEVPPALAEAVFAAPAPRPDAGGDGGGSQYGGTGLGSGGYAVYRLQSVQPGDIEALDSATRERLASLVGDRLGGGVVGSYVESLRSQAEIDVNAEAI